MATAAAAAQARRQQLLSPAAQAQIPECLTRHAGLVTAALRASVPSSHSLLRRMAGYHMGWNDARGHPAGEAAGKLLRPSLCLWACSALGSPAERALPAAVAVEWIHNFTLIHDDVQDRDRLRHHRPTVWTIWGIPQAINAGDALHAWALRDLLRPGRDAVRRLAAARTLEKAVLRVIDGQVIDLRLQGNVTQPASAYLRMVQLKTGALIGASLETGALLGGAAPAAARRLGRAGALAGVAFQIRDDWLGIWGDSALTGKPADGDLGRRKLTFPIVTAYSRADSGERGLMRRLYLHQGADGVTELRVLLERLGVRGLAEQVPRQLAESAVEEVRASGLAPESVSDFQSIANFLATRIR